MACSHHAKFNSNSNGNASHRANVAAAYPGSCQKEVSQKAGGLGQFLPKRHDSLSLMKSSDHTAGGPSVLKQPLTNPQSHGKKVSSLQAKELVAPGVIAQSIASPRDALGQPPLNMGLVMNVQGQSQANLSLMNAAKLSNTTQKA